MQNARIRAEVVKHVFVDLRHLRGVDRERLAFDRLHVSKLRVVDHHSRLIFRRKVIRREALALLRDVLRLQHICNLRQEANRSRIFNAVDNALILCMDQLHCRAKRGVTLSEEIVGILKLRHYADAFKFDRGFLPAPERITQKRRAVVLDNFAPLRKQGIIPDQPAEFIFDRNNEASIIHRKDRRDPVNELRCIHERIRLEL